MEKLEIRKGGKLIETKFVYNKEKEKGEYKEFDRTSQAIRNLFEPCELASDITLKDIFELLNTELDIFDSVIGNWCKEIVTEGLTKPGKPYDLTKYDPEQIEYLELCYSPEYELYKKVDCFYGFHRPDFNGVGVELKNDDELDHYSKGERASWGVSFFAANDLINVPVKLADTFVVYEGILRAPKGKIPSKIIEFKNPTYTLGGILEGIIWEMSFHGEPDKRDAFNTELHEMLDKIKSEEDQVTELTIDAIDNE